MENKDNVFIDGMIFKRPRENAPDFVKGSISIKCAEFYDYMKANIKDGWLNIDLLESKGGKYYAKLNDYNPEKKEEQSPFGDSQSSSPF